jgi:hypothetical protein
MQAPGCDAVMTNVFRRRYLAEQRSEARGSGVTEIARFSHQKLSPVPAAAACWQAALRSGRVTTSAAVRSRRVDRAPRTWSEFLPISIPIVATVAIDLLDMAVLRLTLAAFQHPALVRQEHARTIPLPVIAIGKLVSLSRSTKMKTPLMPPSAEPPRSCVRLDWLGCKHAGARGLAPCKTVDAWAPFA